MLRSNHGDLAVIGIISVLVCHSSNAASSVPGFSNDVCGRSAAAAAFGLPLRTSASRPKIESKRLRWENGGHPGGCRRRATLALRGGFDDDDGEKEGEIFFDDFSGQSIGEGASTFLADGLELEKNERTETSDEGELPEFDEGGDAREEKELVSIPLPRADARDDLAGATQRELSFGPDVVLTDYAGSLGFDEVTDWEYYATDPYSGERTTVSPPPLDPSQPSRTRSKSGSVVRVFRGELGGRLASRLRSKGLDARVLVKEYTGEEAVNLARAEQKGLGRLLSAWLREYLENKNKSELLGRMEEGEWMEAARRRYVDMLTDTPTRKDDENLTTMLELLSSQKAQFTAVLGEMNLNDYHDDEATDPNEWYKALGVTAPAPGSVWLVFEYHGLSTAASYAVPASVRRSRLPPKRGIFGMLVKAPPLPPFRERARYVVGGVLGGMLSAVASAHEGAGVVHRSIGRNSFLLSSTGQDKSEASGPYAVVKARLRVVLSDWGFSAAADEAARDKDLGARSRTFGIPAVDSYEGLVARDDRIDEAARKFAMAEDLHALGLAFLAVLFTTLAEPETPAAPMPPTDDDSWQRLFSEIFEKDMGQFREYCSNEEVWDGVVGLLDGEDGAGWDLLGDLLLARERLGEWYEDGEDGGEGMDGLVSASGLLSHPFFQMKII